MSITEPHDDRDPQSKYEEESKKLLIELGATGVLLIVIGGERGAGFSFSTIQREMAKVVPTVLRGVADEIEWRSQS